MDNVGNGSTNEARSPQRRRNRGWIWFFVLLGVLTVAAITAGVWFNAQQQLTPEKLAEARQKWDQHGPRDYDMEYEFKRIDKSKDTYSVRVRGGKVVAVARNGEPEEERLYRYSDMRALFGFIADYLEQDSQPGQPRTFMVATFDPQDGHLTHFVRSVMSRKERQEITILQFDRNPSLGPR